SASAPEHVGKAQFLDAKRGSQSRPVGPVVAIGGEAVHVVRADAGVGTGFDDRLQRQFEFAIRRLAVLVVGGFADSGDRGFAAQGAFGHRRVRYSFSSGIAGSTGQPARAESSRSRSPASNASSVQGQRSGNAPTRGSSGNRPMARRRTRPQRKSRSMRRFIDG